jgi:hypothetical protein
MPTLIRNRFNISNPAFSRSRQELLHLSLEPPRWLFLPRQGFGSFDIPILILTVKRPAPRDGSAYIAKSAPETAKWNQVFPYVLFARTRPYCGEPAYCLAGDRGAGRRRGDGRRVGWGGGPDSLRGDDVDVDAIPRADARDRPHRDRAGPAAREDVSELRRQCRDRGRRSGREGDRDLQGRLTAWPPAPTSAPGS